MNTILKSKLFSICILLLWCCAVPAGAHDRGGDGKKVRPTAVAPHSLAGRVLVLQIEKAVTDLPGKYPSKGALIKRYTKRGKFTAHATGTMRDQVADQEQVFYGTYKYHRTGYNTAVEKSVAASLNNTPFTVKYTFETDSSGRWEEDYGNGQLMLSGSFRLEAANLPPSQHLAPATIADTNVALIIKTTKSDLPAGAYPAAGLVLQTYAQDGTMIFKGFGPGTLDSTGTYKYTKISANTAVEEVTQVTDFFTLPYTMVYTFDTPTSGVWFQNFGDGLILFRGTFDTFPQ